MFIQDTKVEINSQLIRITRIFSFLKKSLKKKIVINFFMTFFQCQSTPVQKTKTYDMTSMSEWWEQWTTCLQLDFSFSRYRKLKKKKTTRTWRFYEIKKWWFPSVVWNYIVCIVSLQVIWWEVRTGKLVLNLFKICKSHH